MDVYRTTSRIEISPQPWQPLYHVHVDNGDSRCDCGQTVLRQEWHATLGDGESMVFESTITLSS